MTQATGITNVVRPSTFQDVVGLESQITIIQTNVQGAKKRGTPVRSLMICGPSGCGKTTLAHVTSLELGGDIHKMVGTDLTKPDDVLDMAARSKDGDCIYIEEAHTMGGTGRAGKLVQNTIFEWIEEFKITSGGNGVIPCPKVCFIFATTDPGKLLEPLRNRCQRIDVSLYKIDTIKEILVKAGLKMGIDLSVDDEALTLLAQSSRGLPRIAIMGRLDPLLSYLAVHEQSFNLESLTKFFGIMNINEYGLEANDRLYCETLYDIMSRQEGKPAASKTIQQMTGLADNVVEQVIEPYLLQIKFMQITGRGRILTPTAFAKLGLTPIATNSAEKARYAHAKLENLPEILEDDKLRKLGTQALMGMCGMNYFNLEEREEFKTALNRAGYKSVRRSGIIRITDSEAETAELIT